MKARGCGFEVAMEDGTWKHLEGLMVVPGDAIVRAAAHTWDDIPPGYHRCRRCGEVAYESQGEDE